MAFGDCDLAYMLGDIFSDGEKVRFVTPAGNTIEVDAILDEGDQPMVAGDGDVVVAQTSILIATGSLPGARIESELTRAGIRYSIIDGPRMIDDGALSRVYLRRI